MMKYQKTREISILLIVIVILALGSTGCAESSIEYDPPDPNLVGKIIHFKKPIAYIVFTDPKIAKKYGFLYPKINRQTIQREIDSKYSIGNIKTYFPGLPVEHIKDGVSFTIIGSFWVRHDLIHREFAPEYRMLVLRDENNTLSVYLSPDNNLQNSLRNDTDFGER